MSSLARRLEKLESITVAEELSQWQLCLVLSLTEPATERYAENVVTGERSYEEGLLQELSKQQSYSPNWRVKLGALAIRDEEVLAMERLGYVITKERNVL